MSTPVLLILLVYTFKLSHGSALDSASNSTESACGGVYIEKFFTINSPNFPEAYPSDLDCHYLLKGPHCPTYYQFHFLDFSLENSKACKKDKLVIKDQDVLCGDVNQTRTYFARDGSLHLRFKSDQDISGKGYSIQITRMACEKVSEYATEDATTELFIEETTNESTETTVRSIKSRMLIPNNQQPITDHCCGTIYNSERFIITSPNFPHTLNKKTECSFEIQKVSENTCRLRLNFLFFWLGYTNTQNCPHGYLEIDGKYICGCNNDLKLTTTFGDSEIKVIRFQTDGFYQSAATGFILEVIQDECPKKYSPSNSTEHYRIQNDEINRVAWPKDTEDVIEKLQLIDEKTEVLDDDSRAFARNRPKIVKSTYVFAPKEHNSIYFDREDTTYLDLNNSDYVLTCNNYYQCLNWNQMEYNNLTATYGTNLECPRNDENAMHVIEDRQCVELNYLGGYFRSPGYPCYYPSNLNVCYRLKKLPGYCAINVFIQDFQIENSLDCTKDYLLLADGSKHCGNSLNKASWCIDLRDKDYEDITFVTDDNYCARGFTGVYQQIACHEEVPTYPVDTTTPSITTTTPVHDYCDKIITDKSFVVEVNQDHSVCTFSIQKYNEAVCKINLFFEKFDIVCGVESLTIDGTMYCGHLTGKVVKVNTNNGSLDIVYMSTLENKYDDYRFKISGEQIKDDCLYVELPDLQRLLSNKPAVETETNNSVENNIDLQTNSKYLIAFVNKNFKDICGIVTNSTEKELPSSFCETLEKDHNVTKCMPFKKEIVREMPFEKKKLGIELFNQNNVTEFEELEINEIDCDDLHL